ncbi:hypothetical protein NC653_022225 [Populus alba x Populus x berolinensis]|uniref:Uncharacterized protein n=1 Tax=Populus alba x Populus x berolinensis TaxID=444605 RepID=A0AAD6MF11_9ROSI|nr:hypothetical protein NC653_022225 [Populus alba x Populus x berolinensis]
MGTESFERPSPRTFICINIAGVNRPQVPSPVFEYVPPSSDERLKDCLPDYTGRQFHSSKTQDDMASNRSQNYRQNKLPVILPTQETGAKENSAVAQFSRSVLEEYQAKIGRSGAGHRPWRILLALWDYKR